MKFIVQGRCQDEYGQSIVGVKVNISYWYYTRQANQNVAYRLRSSTNTAQTVTDDKGKFRLEINLGKEFNTPGLNVAYNDPEHPFTFTFTKDGYQLGTIKNPIFNVRKTSSDEVFLTTNPEFKSYIDPIVGGKLQLSDQFESGKWKISSISPDKVTDIDRELKELYTFISNNPRNTKIEINSSESQPTNSDNEESSPTYKQTLPPRGLAKKRATALKEYVLQKLQEFSTANPNSNFILPTIVINNPIIGQTPWPDTEKNKQYLKLENKRRTEQGEPAITNPAQLSRYKKEQWVELKASLIVEKTGCIGNGYIIFDIITGEFHGCDSAVYELYANGQLLKRDDGKPFASLNNMYDIYFTTKNLVDKFKNIQTPPLPITNTPIAQDTEMLNYLAVMKQYDNVASGYHNINSTGNSEGRFKEIEEGSQFPTPTTPFPPTQIPKTAKDAGLRYNRFIIDPSLAKQLTQSNGSEKIKFEIKCQGMYKGNKQIISPYFGKDCHGGIGDFILYNLQPDANGKLIVKYTSYKLTGKSPKTKDVFTWLFTFDPCTNTIEKNRDVFDLSTVEETSSEPEF